MILQKIRWYIQGRCIRCGEKLTWENSETWGHSSQCKMCIAWINHHDQEEAAKRRAALSQDVTSSKNKSVVERVAKVLATYDTARSWEENLTDREREFYRTRAEEVLRAAVGNVLRDA